jgi:hypothetical protein
LQEKSLVALRLLVSQISQRVGMRIDEAGSNDQTGCVDGARRFQL